MSETLIQVKERPLLFSGPMVRALLARTKTQTRRDTNLHVVNIQPDAWEFTGMQGGHAHFKQAVGTSAAKCPYGQPGDRLWVRETWGAQKQFNGLPPSALFTTGPTPIYYRADNNVPERLDTWRPSIHMPRAASRLLLEITAVRVERVQDISEADAVAEGVSKDFWFRLDWKYPVANQRPIACQNYASLWQEINGPDSWAANPWVWVVEFKVIEPTA